MYKYKPTQILQTLAFIDCPMVIWAYNDGDHIISEDYWKVWCDLCRKPLSREASDAAAITWLEIGQTCLNGGQWQPWEVAGETTNS